MGYYDFPHTRNYDTDLGYLIKRYFELNVDFESLEKNFNDLKAWCIAQLNSEALKTLVANKLDEWLQDGTLEALINNPLNHVTTYDTIVEMLTHSALLEGSKIYCTGADTVNDGNGGHFRIRARLSTDVIDNYHLYLIDGGVKVAVRLTDSSTANKKYIFIADSYGNYTNSNSQNFIDVACSYLNINASDYYDFHRGSAGFSRSGDLNFLKVLQDNESSITNKNEITDIYVLGGANDQTTNSADTINNGIIAFINYVKANYKNAIIYIGFVSKSFEYDFYGNAQNTFNCYSNSVKYGAIYLNNSESITQQFSMFRSDRVHPTESAVNEIGTAVAQLIKTKTCDIKKKVAVNAALKPDHSWVTVNGATLTYNTSFNSSLNNGDVSIFGKGGLVLLDITFRKTAPSIAFEEHIQNLIELDDTFMLSNNNDKGISGFCNVITSSGNYNIPYTAWIPKDLVDGKPVLNMFLYPDKTITGVDKILFFGSNTTYIF